MNAKKIISGILSAALALSMAACSAAPATTEQPAAQPAQTQTQAAAETPKQEAAAPETQPAAQQVESAKAPKYVFLFIGDGMSYPQFQAASDYLGALADSDYTQALPSNSYDDRAGAVLDGPEALNFMNFDVAGSAVTYDSCSFAPDSASTATSIATGYKTYSGMINVDITGSTPYETIAEKLHSQKGWKVGIISSVNLNHATPAAFYAHQASRNNYYEIGEELVASGFEYFAGGGLKKVTGPDKDKTSLYDLAADAGYKVTYTQADAEAVTAADEKVILIDEHLADSDAMDYEMDRQDGEWALADYVEKGIEVLDNDTGFFMMCEGGKIDWACHANDAAASIHDVIEMHNAVQAAVEFYAQHPDDTLILVTADHETGGLGIGYKTTNYDTFLTNLAHQKMSYAKFDSTYVNNYVKNRTPFETAMQDVKANFGLTLPTDPDAANAGKLLLTDYEVENLRTAYERTLKVGSSSQSKMSQQDYELYGTYIPFSMAICHTINHKSGVDHTTYAHTGAMVNLYARGQGADKFRGVYDNTEIFHKLAELTDVQ